MTTLVVITILSVFILTIFSIAGYLQSDNSQGEIIQSLQLPEKTSLLKSVVFILVAVLFLTAILWLTIKMLNSPLLMKYFHSFAIFANGLVIAYAIIIKRNMNLSRMSLFAALALLLTLVCFVWPNWLTIDIAGASLAIGSLVIWLKLVKNLKIWHLALFYVPIIIYDLIHVFGTKMIIVAATKSMAAASLGMIVVPGSLDFSAKIIYTIGLADIFLPGLVIMLGYKTAIATGSRIYAWAPLLFYFVGLFITFITILVFKTGQPATLYLCPCVLMGYGVAYLQTRKSGQLVYAG